MLEHWIWLARRTGLSDYLRMRLVQHFSSAAEVYEAGAREFQELSWLRSDAVKSLLDKNLTEEKKILGECMEKNVGILCLEDSGYPTRLKSIFDPPMVLYVLGTLPDVDENPVIGIVGTRHPSAYGSAAAWRMGYGIASGGGIVVSGMAMGVDGTAMNGALAAGAPVIGVLGCGIDEIYPKSNRELFADTRRQAASFPSTLRERRGPGGPSPDGTGSSAASAGAWLWWRHRKRAALSLPCSMRWSRAEMCLLCRETWIFQAFREATG